MKTMTVLSMALAMRGGAFGQDWVQTQKITAEEPVEGESLGFSSGFDGQTFVLGAAALSGATQLEGAA